MDERNEKIRKADKIKDIGNDMMRNSKFDEALKYYTIAINMYNENAVYYVNRAAAYIKLNEIQNALKDLEKAIRIDPKYAKCYGRLGLAYGSLNNHQFAMWAFKKALELDPGNENYHRNLKIAEEKAAEQWNDYRVRFHINPETDVDWIQLYRSVAFNRLASNARLDRSMLDRMAARLAGPNPPVPIPTSEMTGPTAEIARNLERLLDWDQIVDSVRDVVGPVIHEQARGFLSRLKARFITNFIRMGLSGSCSTPRGAPPNGPSPSGSPPSGSPPSGSSPSGSSPSGSSPSGSSPSGSSPSGSSPSGSSPSGPSSSNK